jgi:DNA primase
MNKSEIDLVQVVEASGVELKKSGVNLMGVCPFHADKNPSMSVSRERFHCFGCGERGDVIDYVRKKHGLSYPEAKRQLGLSEEKPDPAVARQIERQKALLKEYEKWQVDYSNEIGLLLRAGRKLMHGLTEAEFEKSTFLQDFETWEYHLNVLAVGSKQECFQLYQEVKHGRSVRTAKAA